jgi:ComF family protein
MAFRIIAHSPDSAPRRVLRGAARAWRALLARVGSDCPACARASRGGLLCAACSDEVLRASPRPRCRRCALALGGDAGTAGGHASSAQDDGLCIDCRLHPPAFQRAVAAFDYAAPHDRLIARFKRGRRYVLAGALAQLLHGAVQEAMSADSAAGMPLDALRLDALVPIPAGRGSLRERGFNPAGELAAALSRRLETRLLRGVLRRRRENEARQSSLGRDERLAATRGLYECAHPLDGLRVGLVDDVMTTGSTADAAARALLAAGAQGVMVLVAARTPAPRGV